MKPTFVIPWGIKEALVFMNCTFTIQTLYFVNITHSTVFHIKGMGFRITSNCNTYNESLFWDYMIHPCKCVELKNHGRAYY